MTSPRRFPRCTAALFLGWYFLSCCGPVESQEGPAKPPEGPWWSLKPLVKPLPPPVKEGQPADWSRNAIDLFILEKLAEKGLRPSPEADKRTLLRRLTFDLVGLPPTPEEQAAFLADSSPQAYDRVVERLLASPHYGERWARHWMDVVHYAETHGHDQDRPRPNAWPYRDYLIQALNADKPYARFLQDQIAADVLAPQEAQSIAALGFLATGPWDESSLMSINEDTIDKKVARYLDRDDMVTTTLATFTSTTVHCARCHDHKFDPIPQKDYYALQAVFAGVDKAERAYDPDPRTATRRRELLQKKAELQARKGKPDLAWLTPAVQAEVDAWEKQLVGTVSLWSPLDPTAAVSSGGATLTRQPDLSLLAEGKKPEKDVYTITAVSELQGITAIRLEVLTDPSLPHNGPGRQDNGNLHLNEFKVQIASKNDPDNRKPVKLQSPSADFNQDGWSIGLALDNNPATAWGIYPMVGKPHRAVFELQDNVGFPGGTIFTFTLEQTHGGGHLIGRARLSLTTAARPLSVTKDTLPDSISLVLALPLEKRTPAQRGELAVFMLEQQVERDLAALPPPQMVYAATKDFKGEGNFQPAKAPRTIHVLTRGEVTKPGDEAVPGALTCVQGLDAVFRLKDPNQEGERRAALALWLSDPKNVLTWRSVANRIWHYHFGRGLVDTPNDLGRMGAKPTHPELLDWLACHFQEGGGSLKELHRLIVTSAVYRQASLPNEQGVLADADNRYLWRMNRARLDAESLRDAVLLITGKLDRQMGGPSVKQFIQTPGIHVTPNVDYLNFDVDRPETRRRSVYRFIFRTLPDPFMEALDCPDFSQLTPVRTSSVTAMQALSLLHNRFMVRMSEHLAERAAQAGPELNDQVRELYRLTLGREPTEKEQALVANYATKHGAANAARMLLNSNEMMFVP